MNRNEIILETGIGIGLTSGVITTLGLIVGPPSGMHSRAIMIGGILTIAISDTLGIRMSEESKNSSHPRSVWEATLATFAAKFVIAATMWHRSSPVHLIIIGVICGLILLTVLSFFLIQAQAISLWKVIGEHLVIALCLVVITHAVGDWVKGFGEVE